MKKGLKIFTLFVVAAVLLTPVAAHAKGPKFSFSFNFSQPSHPGFVAPCPPPPVFVPAPPPRPYIERRTVVREYQYPCQCPDCYVQEFRAPYPYAWYY